jgi:hypothetical protein
MFNHDQEQLLGKRDHLDRTRQRPADGIFLPKPVLLLGESASTSLMIQSAKF